MHGWIVAIIAIGLPALELAGIVLIWRGIGAWTLVWLASGVLAGVWVLRKEHMEFLPRLSRALFDGHTPFAALFTTARRVIAGLLLIFPGAGSDLLALVLLLWPGGPPPRSPRRGPSGPDDVIEGDFRRLD